MQREKRDILWLGKASIVAIRNKGHRQKIGSPVHGDNQVKVRDPCGKIGNMQF